MLCAPLLYSDCTKWCLKDTRGGSVQVYFHLFLLLLLLKAMEACALSYHKFVKFAVEEAQLHTDLAPVSSMDKFRYLKPIDGKTSLQTLSFKAPKLRLLRSLNIDGNNAMQVLDLAAFPEPVFDLPIFCANFFSTPRLSIVVLDLNPLYDVTDHKGYKEKYYNQLLYLGNKYSKVMPWGDKITGESLKFFSPIVLWTKFPSSTYMHDVLYSAFVDYFKAWVKLVDEATEETDTTNILRNREAQHRYLTWRAEKDPGRSILQKLVGDTLAEEIVRDFLFDGVSYLEPKTFLDYFPEYRCEDGTVNRKRSIMGKAYDSRPWDERGNFTSG